MGSTRKFGGHGGRSQPLGWSRAAVLSVTTLTHSNRAIFRITDDGSNHSCKEVQRQEI